MEEVSARSLNHTHLETWPYRDTIHQTSCALVANLRFSNGGAFSEGNNNVLQLLKIYSLHAPYQLGKGKYNIFVFNFAENCMVAL